MKNVVINKKILVDYSIYSTSVVLGKALLDSASPK